MVSVLKMIIPLVGFSDTGEPLINAVISGDEAAAEPHAEVLRRLGLASPTVFCMPEAVLAAGPTAAHVPLLRSNPTIVGPFSFSAAGHARAWLDGGTGGCQYALFAQPPGGTTSWKAMVDAAAAEKLPAERLMLLLEVPTLVDTTAVRVLAASVESLAASKGSGCYECCRYALLTPRAGPALSSHMLTISLCVVVVVVVSPLRAESVGVFSGVVLVVPPGTAAAREQELLQLLAPIAVNDRLQIIVGGLCSWAGSSTGAAMTGQLHHTNICILSTAQLGPATASPGLALPPSPTLPSAGSAAALIHLFRVQPLQLGPCVAACVRSDRSDGCASQRHKSRLLTSSLRLFASPLRSALCRSASVAPPLRLSLLSRAIQLVHAASLAASLAAQAVPHAGDGGRRCRSGSGLLLCSLHRRRRALRPWRLLVSLAWFAVAQG